MGDFCGVGGECVVELVVLESEVGIAIWVF